MSLMSRHRDGAKALPAALAVTMGEPAGIGGEIALAAWRQRYEHALAPFFMIDDPDRLAALAHDLGWEVAVRPIDAPEQATAVFGEALPVLPLPLPLPAPVVHGRPDPANGTAVIESIRRAAALVQAGRAAAMVTNPIQKSSLYRTGFTYPGHTEYLATLAGTGRPPAMMLACPELRVVPVTIHIPLSAVPAALTAAAISHCALLAAQALRRDLGIPRPRLSIAALNPHAGEDGTLGREEIEIIIPAIHALQRQSIAVDGPHPADTLFHERARAGFDAAICMYHDQALIPLKTIDFDRGVNITLGLSLVRTSPDHGTALAIAGKGIAKPCSFIEALRLADRMAANRARRAALA